MKNKYKFLFALMFSIVFLLYRVDSAAAMADVQPDTFDAQTDINAETEQPSEPAPGAETEQPPEPAAESETEQSPEPASESEAEQPVEPASEPEAEQPMESAPEPDSVATGTALIEWLELHKNTGGTVRLADNVVLEGYYSFCPNGINMPSVFVDTDKYTITVTGEMEFLSDDHLIFSGQPDGKGIFYVAEKGMLSMQGVVVESGQCALWQEEGAGLVVSGGHIAGSIHYADTPFVMYENHICVIVEKGQTVNDVLPSQISCTVNRQGQVSHNEMVPLSWSLKGTEKQQEKRMRFQVQGSFLYASSGEPALCTVVYNDHPLTFTDVRASVSGSLYTFQGWYTKPEEHLPITVMAEYSFDGARWFLFEEETVTDTNDTFFIALQSEQHDTAAYPNIYIRLQWNDSGTRYFSNVLCYAADDLEYVADIGGSRGGGTSITNPPDDPQKSTGDISSEEEGAVPNANGNTDEGELFYAEPPTTDEDGSFSFYSETADTNAGQSLYAESQDVNAGQPFCSEAKTENDAGNGNVPDNKEDIDRSDSDAVEKEEGVVAAVSVYVENSADLPQIKDQTLRSDIYKNDPIVIAAGFVLLSAIAGIAGFCIHSRSGTNR